MADQPTKNRLKLCTRLFVEVEKNRKYISHFPTKSFTLADRNQGGIQGH